MAVEATTIDLNNTDEQKVIASRNQGFQINISKEHGNWLTTGEIIRYIQKPISIYIDEIVKAFHKQLCNDLLAIGIGKCKSPGDCKTKMKSRDLCISCQGWITELKASHEKGDNPAWHKNCDSSRWSEDHWEVAKFFMPALGSNLTTVKDAETTDLSSLLNVLEWMKDKAFLGKTRVNVDLVKKLRSQVRNTWAHAPKQELPDDEKAEDFSIANDFLEDLQKVFPSTENVQCLKYLEQLKTNGVTNVAESELQLSMLLQRHLLNDIKEEITRMNDERSSDKNAIEEYQQKLNKLECALNECLQRMSDFKNLKENIDKQFDIFAEKLECFRAIPEDIREIRSDIGKIRDDLTVLNIRQNEERQPRSCLPEKLPMFIAREYEIQNIISSLKDEGKAIASLHGGPGFGKTAIAIVVSHMLSKDHSIQVVFSDLSTATTVDEMIREMCRDVSVYHDEDPKSSLIFWLKNITDKVIFVLEDIDNLLLASKTAFFAFICSLLKNSNQRCQIVTTSRASYQIPQLESSTAKVQVNEMDDEASVQLLTRKCLKEDGHFALKLAKLCGNIPLAMCIAGSRVNDFKNSNELLQHLEKQPIKTLECPVRNQYIERAINISYEKLDEEEKEIFVRLAVFEGSFSEEAAGEVIEKENLDTNQIMKNLVFRSLVKQPIKHRYSIHLLIKHFLNVQTEKEEKRAEKVRAEVLMIKYYLKLGNDLTIKSYSKDGYKANREALKKEAHNIQNMLKICCQQENSTSEISTCLVDSDIYTTSCRYFSIFVRTIISGSTVDEFLQWCAKLAEEKKQHANKITFYCLLADQERTKSIGKSHEVFDDKMNAINKEFETHNEEVKGDKSICAHYHYQYGRYLLYMSGTDKGEKPLDSLNNARKQFEMSLALRTKLTDTSLGKADKVFSLLQLGNIWKKIAVAERNMTVQGEAYKKSFGNAQDYYEQAIELSKSDLGEHDLTSMCYKNLADQLLTTTNYERAKENYGIAKEMKEDLDLHARRSYVYLLNNLGQCLMHSGRVKEAKELLESALNMAEKLSEDKIPTTCMEKVQESLAKLANISANNPKKSQSMQKINWRS